MMLYPQDNTFREARDLSGFWDFRFATDADEAYDPAMPAGQPIAVPASWNDQFADGRDNLGPAWYQTRFFVPAGWDGGRIYLRFNSVNYLADVWLNDEPLGGHEGGHLPFVFDITDRAQTGADNRLVVRVDGRLAPGHVPPGDLPPGTDSIMGGRMRGIPPTSFDFFPFCGIQRPVIVYTTPAAAIDDVTVTTDIDGSTGVVQVRAEAVGVDAPRFRCTLRGHGAEVSATFGAEGATLHVPDARLWGPGHPDLYALTVELLDGDSPVDAYALDIGIRTISVQGDRLLLNGEPVVLTGFGRHEDFPVAGRGLMPALIIKDYALMEWVGANSFRTSHYPYSEQMMDLADRLGFLVIDETPAVGLFFGDALQDRRLELCRQYTRDLIARDKNHPSVIMWSLANEPGSSHPAAKDFFRNLYDLARDLDPTRPITVVNRMDVREEAAFEFVDVVCINRYYGWYIMSGDLPAAGAAFEAELDALHARYGKPIIIGEFGADTIPGHHAQPPEVFSEEYQADMMTTYIEVMNRKPFVAGQHVWNMCDFKTGQLFMRTKSMNFKGVFTRDRRPKLAAHRLRQLWGEKK